MIFAHDKLPLEYSPREMLRIYVNRLLVLSGVIVANLILLALVVFALKEPGVFVVALTWIAAFGMVCWWTSRNATFVKLREVLAEKPLDLASDAEAIAAIWALLGVSSAGAAPRHQKRVEVGRLVVGRSTLGEELQRARRFHSDVVYTYFRSIAKMFGAEKKEQCLKLADMSKELADRLGEALLTIPPEDLGKYFSERDFGDDRQVHMLDFWRLAPFLVSNANDIHRISKKKSLPDELRFIKAYMSAAPAAWDRCLHTHFTSQTHHEIEVFKSMAHKLDAEMRKLTHD